MSTAAKGTTLRLIMPRDSSTRVVAALGPTAKFESSDTIVSAGRLTTDKLVGYIKDYSRLRDEVFHTIRQLGVARNARTASTPVDDYAGHFSKTKEGLEEKKSEYQEIQSRIDSLDKQIDEIGLTERLSLVDDRHGATAHEVELLDDHLVLEAWHVGGFEQAWTERPVHFDRGRKDPSRDVVER